MSDATTTISTPALGAGDKWAHHAAARIALDSALRACKLGQLATCERLLDRALGHLDAIAALRGVSP